MDTNDDLPGWATDRQLRELSVDPHHLRRGYRSPDGDDAPAYPFDERETGL